MAMLFLAGCPDPCDELAEALCVCETGNNRAQKELCVKEKKIWLSQASEDEEVRDKICLEAFQTCNCQLYSEGHDELCGMTRNPDN